MRRLRVQFASLSVAVAALFALTTAAPRPALLYHEHAGGTHAHAHVDAEDLADLLEHHSHRHDHDAEHDRGHSHHHHDYHDRDRTAAAPAPRCPAAVAIDATHGVLAQADADASGHWHEQPRFHRAAIAATPAIAVSAFTAPAAQQPSGRPAPAALPAGQARAPPHTTALA
jgi:hypothetical protein